MKMSRLCGNIMCRYQFNDECYSSEDNLVPYIFKGDMSESSESCQGYKNRQGGEFEKKNK